MRNLLSHFHYYSLVLKNAFDILKGLRVYEHIFLPSSKSKKLNKISVQFTQSCPTLCDPLSCSTCQASLSITNSLSLLKLMFIASVMPSKHLMLCCPLLLLPSIFPSIRVFSNETALHIRWHKYLSFSFSISPSNEHSGLISF